MSPCASLRMCESLIYARVQPWWTTLCVVSLTRGFFLLQIAHSVRSNGIEEAGMTALTESLRSLPALTSLKYVRLRWLVTR